jgi:WhiB family redox-sensing transcriptional regulator
MNDDLSRGACIGEDPELFFPVGKTGPSRPQVDRAKQVCHHCPVQQHCLDVALGRSGPVQEYGVWGGMGEDERRALLLRERRAAARNAAPARSI